MGGQSLVRRRRRALPGPSRCDRDAGSCLRGAPDTGSRRCSGQLHRLRPPGVLPYARPLCDLCPGTPAPGRGIGLFKPPGGHHRPDRHRDPLLWPHLYRFLESGDDRHDRNPPLPPPGPPGFRDPACCHSWVHAHARCASRHLCVVLETPCDCKDRPCHHRSYCHCVWSPLSRAARPLLACGRDDPGGPPRFWWWIHLPSAHVPSGGRVAGLAGYVHVPERDRARADHPRPDRHHCNIRRVSRGRGPGGRCRDDRDLPPLLSSRGRHRPLFRPDTGFIPHLPCPPGDRLFVRRAPRLGPDPSCHADPLGRNPGRSCRGGLHCAHAEGERDLGRACGRRDRSPAVLIPFTL